MSWDAVAGAMIFLYLCLEWHSHRLRRRARDLSGIARQRLQELPPVLMDYVDAVTGDRGTIRAVYDRIPINAELGWLETSEPVDVSQFSGFPGPGWEYSPTWKEWRRCRWIKA